MARPRPILTHSPGAEITGAARISACVVCRNETDRLGACLESLACVDEIIVMDLSSTDDSLAVAKRAGARVVSRAPVPIVEQVRNEIAAYARGEWSLVVDPDERISPGLAAALRGAAAEQQWHAVVIPRMNCDLGYPPTNPKERFEPQLRMYRPEHVVWPVVPNALPDVETERRCELPPRDEFVLIHERNRNVAEALERVMRYAPAEGQAWLDQGFEFSARAMLADLGIQMYRQLIYGRAWRDGVPGILRVGFVFAFRLYTWAAFWQAAGGRRTVTDDRLLRRLGFLIEPLRAALRLAQVTHDGVSRVLRRRRP